MLWNRRRTSTTLAGVNMDLVRRAITLVLLPASRSTARGAERYPSRALRLKTHCGKGLAGADGASVQPVLLLELAGQVALGEVLEVLVRQGVELVLEPAGEHALDLRLPGLLREPRVAQQLFGARDVLV